MKINQQETKRRMEHFHEVCRSAGVKLTHQRLEIFRQVAASTEHPDAETLHRSVRRKLPTVSLDTVYRTLWLLKDLELIQVLGPPRERTRFDANLSRHHHFVCSRCGLTRDFYSRDLEKMKLPRSLEQFGRVDSAQVEVRGICHHCAEEEA